MVKSLLAWVEGKLTMAAIQLIMEWVLLAGLVDHVTRKAFDTNRRSL
jgi:hypothetical protein